MNQFDDGKPDVSVRLPMGRRVVASTDDGRKEFWYIPLGNPQPVEVFDVDTVTPDNLNPGSRCPSYLDMNPDLHKILKLPHATSQLQFKGICNVTAGTHPVITSMDIIFEPSSGSHLEFVSIQGDHCIQYSNVFTKKCQSSSNNCFISSCGVPDETTIAALTISPCSTSLSQMHSQGVMTNTNMTQESDNIEDSLSPSLFKDSSSSCPLCLGPLSPNHKNLTTQTHSVAMYPQDRWRVWALHTKRCLGFEIGNEINIVKGTSEDEWDDSCGNDDDDDSYEANNMKTADAKYWISPSFESKMPFENFVNPLKTSTVQFESNDHSTTLRRVSMSPSRLAAMTIPSNEHSTNMRVSPLPSLWVLPSTNNKSKVRESNTIKSASFSPDRFDSPRPLRPSSSNALTLHSKPGARFGKDHKETKYVNNVPSISNNQNKMPLHLTDTYLSSIYDQPSISLSKQLLSSATRKKITGGVLCPKIVIFALLPVDRAIEIAESLRMTQRVRRDSKHLISEPPNPSTWKSSNYVGVTIVLKVEWPAIPCSTEELLSLKNAIRLSRSGSSILSPTFEHQVNRIIHALTLLENESDKSHDHLLN